MKRSAKALWQGNLKEGKGTLDSQSGALSSLNYSFAKRFGDERGTNPEELIAAAHAGCFAMAFSAELEKNKMIPDSINVEAQVNLEKLADGFSINKINLVVNAVVPGADEAKVRSCAEEAKANCPVSKLLNADITMDFSLKSYKAAA